MQAIDKHSLGPVGEPWNQLGSKGDAVGERGSSLAGAAGRERTVCVWAKGTH